MVVFLGFYKRKPGLTLAQFHQHWREIHGPLIAENPACREHMHRYVQHQIAPGVPGAQPLEYDGFSEAWYESLDARAQLRLDPRFKIVTDDSPLFLDMSKTSVQMVDTQIVQIGKDHAREWMSRAG